MEETYFQNIIPNFSKLVQFFSASGSMSSSCQTHVGFSDMYCGLTHYHPLLSCHWHACPAPASEKVMPIWTNIGGPLLAVACCEFHLEETVTAVSSA